MHCYIVHCCHKGLLLCDNIHMQMTIGFVVILLFIVIGLNNNRNQGPICLSAYSVKLSMILCGHFMEVVYYNGSG